MSRVSDAGKIIARARAEKGPRRHTPPPPPGHAATLQPNQSARRGDNSRCRRRRRLLHASEVTRCNPKGSTHRPYPWVITRQRNGRTQVTEKAPNVTAVAEHELVQLAAAISPRFLSSLSPRGLLSPPRSVGGERKSVGRVRWLGPKVRLCVLPRTGALSHGKVGCHKYSFLACCMASSSHR